MAELQGIKGIPTEPQLRKPSTYTDYLEGLKGRIFKESVMEPGFIESLTAPEGSPIDYQNISSTAGGRVREMFVDPMRRFGTAIDKGMTGKPLTIGDQLNLIEGMIDTTIGGLFQHSASKGFKNFDPNTLHMFVGPKAKDIVKAEKMVMRGASPAEIQSKLLMHKKPDGMWRKEISDEAMSLKEFPFTPKEAVQDFREDIMVGSAVGMEDILKDVSKYEGMGTAEVRGLIKQKQAEISTALDSNDLDSVRGIMDKYKGLDSLKSMMERRRYGPLEKYVDNNELFKEYPELSQLHTRRSEDIEGGGQGVYLRGDAGRGEQIGFQPQDMRSKELPIVGHELQHAVQQKEGWARGGSPGQFMQESRQGLADKWNDFDDRVYEKIDNAVGLSKFTPEEARKIVIENTPELLKEYEALRFMDSMSSEKAFDKYQNLLGEREARSTAERLGMSLEERRGSLPDVGEGATVLMRGIGDVSQPQASYPVYQGRSKRGLTDFTNPDKVAWGTTDRGTAEQFADVKESYFPYRKPPETVREMRGEIYDLDFDIKKPMDVDISETLWSREKELAKIQEAKDKGFDGLRIKHPSGKIDYVAFSGDQVTRSGGSDIKSISTKLKESGVDNFMYERGDTVTIQSIKVPKSEQGKGVGTKAMEDVLSYADNSSKVVALTPSTDFGASSISRLKKFYKKLGFVENKGKDKDYEISESMYRLPK